ncbi:glycosyltransferase family 4 protein [Pedosphaera parvula]|uniref:Glycosyl transferase group 1 n=1 Tax=Pedosphaera parvula (strain Ellin514) TaxID=320771 RepID=B9XAY3_PEDPL|nr:glycosyltransferase family 4 protein [Pedosphaera parvula]EEF63168.1 glycosyl transferase group 1 [Pedosphaera parvula Ellin514]
MNVPVLLVGNFLSASGGSRGVCEELALRLSASATKVLTTSNKPNKILRICDMLRTIFKVRHEYKVAQVDVYSGPAFIWAELTCALLRSLKKPYVLTLHGGNLPRFSKEWPKRVTKLLSFAEVVTTPSRYLLEQMIHYRGDLLLLPNALDLQRYECKIRDPAQPKLVWLRAFHEIYNPSLAVRVVRFLADKFPEVQLTMIGPDKGDGSLKQTQNQAYALGVADRITIAGGVPKEKVGEWLNRGDIFLNTTNVDNAPVSVIEAMACGLCVVSTNVGGLPYLLDDGYNSLLTPSNNAEAMALATRRILTNPALGRQLSKNGRTKAEQHDWSVVLPQWEALFQSIAKSRLSDHHHRDVFRSNENEALTPMTKRRSL